MLTLILIYINVICKDVLPLDRLLFHSVAGLLGCAEAVQSDAISLVDFCLLAFAFGALRQLLTLAPDQTKPTADEPPSAQRFLASVVIISSGFLRGVVPRFCYLFQGYF